MKKQKSIVFYQANNMVKNDGLEPSRALKIAWQIYRMKKQPDTVFSFIYKKVDGTTRFARGRFDQSICASDMKAQHYFDLDKRDYRAFKPCNFVEIFDQVNLHE